MRYTRQIYRGITTTMSVIIPYELIKRMVEIEPILVGRMQCVNWTLRRHYAPKVDEFKTRLLRPGREIYTSYTVLPNGRKHGLETNRTHDGHVLYTVPYVDGVRHGTCTKYWMNGVVKSTVEYIGGMRQGICTYIHRDTGAVFITKPYRNDKLHGRVIRYTRGGRIDRVREYVDGVKHGLYILYFDAIVRACEYADGKRNGAYYQYDYDGNVLEHGAYKDGRFDGEYVSYYANGAVGYTSYYIDGKIADGEVRCYHREGMLEHVEYYIDGVEDLNRRRGYHPNGVDLKKIGWGYGYKTTTRNYMKFYQSGAVKERLFVVGGKKIIYVYYENGELERKRPLLNYDDDY